ncbi:MAG: MerR family transcriptional regulator, partial [Alkalispirochaetaceae bacterium]
MRRVVGTQEMAELLGVKPHVLRYWEQEIPLIAPDRDTGGRKVYREQDLRLLHRLRHLIIEKRHTVQGALERILDEAAPEQAPRKAALEGLRAELLALRGRLLAPGDGGAT